MANEVNKKGGGGLKGVLSKLLKYGLPLIISVGLCVVLFRNMNISEMVAFVKSDCDFTWIFVSIGIGLLGFLFRAMRWQIQLRASDVDAPLMPVVYSIVGTYAVNLVFPRLGEVWRSEYIARRQKAPFGTVFGSMVAERASDTLTVALLFAVTFLLSGGVLKRFVEEKMSAGDDGGSLLTSVWTYVIIAAVIVLAIVLWMFRHTKLVMKIRKLLSDLWGGFTSIFHMKGGWKWLLLTVLLWGSYLLQMWACFEAFGTTRQYMAQDGFIIVLVCFVLGSISMGVPSNGGIGPYQIAIAFGLQCFVSDIDQTVAYSFGNVVLGAQTLLVIVCGLISFGLIALDNRRQTLREMRPENKNIE